MPIGGCGDGVQGVQLLDDKGTVLATYPVQGGFIQIPDIGLGCGLTLDSDGCVVARQTKFRGNDVLPADMPAGPILGSSQALGGGDVVPLGHVTIVDWCAGTSCTHPPPIGPCKMECATIRGNANALYSGGAGVGATLNYGCFNVQANCAGSIEVTGNLDFRVETAGGTGSLCFRAYINGIASSTYCCIYPSEGSGFTKRSIPVNACIPVVAGSNQMCVELRLVANTNNNQGTLIRFLEYAVSAQYCGSC